MNVIITGGLTSAQIGKFLSQSALNLLPKMQLLVHTLLSFVKQIPPLVETTLTGKGTFWIKYAWMQASLVVQTVFRRHSLLKGYTPRLPHIELDEERRQEAYRTHIQAAIYLHAKLMGPSSLVWLCLVKVYVWVDSGLVRWFQNIDFTKTEPGGLTIAEALALLLYHVLKGLSLLVYMWSAVCALNAVLFFIWAKDSIILPFSRGLTTCFYRLRHRVESSWAYLHDTAKEFVVFSSDHAIFFTLFFLTFIYYVELRTEWLIPGGVEDSKVLALFAYVGSALHLLRETDRIYNIDLGWVIATFGMFFVFAEPCRHWWSRGQYYTYRRALLYDKLTYLWFAPIMLTGWGMVYVLSGAGLDYAYWIPKDWNPVFELQFLGNQLYYTATTWWNPLKLGKVLKETWEFRAPEIEWALERKFWRHLFIKHRNLVDDPLINTPKDFQTLGSRVIGELPLSLRALVHDGYRWFQSLLKVNQTFQEWFPWLYFKFVLPASAYFAHQGHMELSSAHLFTEFKAYYLRTPYFGARWYKHNHAYLTLEYFSQRFPLKIIGRRGLRGISRRRRWEFWLLDHDDSYDEYDDFWLYTSKNGRMRIKWWVALRRWRPLIIVDPGMEARARQCDDFGELNVMFKRTGDYKPVWDLHNPTRQMHKWNLLELRYCRLHQYYLGTREIGGTSEDKELAIAIYAVEPAFELTRVGPKGGYTFGRFWVKDSLTRPEALLSESLPQYKVSQSIRERHWLLLHFMPIDSYFYKVRFGLYPHWGDEVYIERWIQRTFIMRSLAYVPEGYQEPYDWLRPFRLIYTHDWTRTRRNVIRFYRHWYVDESIAIAWHRIFQIVSPTLEVMWTRKLRYSSIEFTNPKPPGSLSPFDGVGWVWWSPERPGRINVEECIPCERRNRVNQLPTFQGDVDAH